MRITEQSHPEIVRALRAIEEDNGGHLIGHLYPDAPLDLHEFQVAPSWDFLLPAAEAGLGRLREASAEDWSEFVVGEESAAEEICRTYGLVDARRLMNDWFNGFSADAEIEALRLNVLRLDAAINTPEIDNFLEGVKREAAHQRERWGSAHDRSKSAENWYWLVGYLAGKVSRAAILGDKQKAQHHTISSAAALFNWHQAISADQSGCGLGQDLDLKAKGPVVEDEGSGLNEHPKVTLTDGEPVTDDHREINLHTGQQKGYVVLSAEDRAKGFVRPVRRSYKHLTCGAVTSMASAIAETYARDPGFYSGTFCVNCRGHFPIGETGEFVWDGTVEKVGT